MLRRPCLLLAAALLAAPAFAQAPLPPEIVQALSRAGVPVTTAEDEGWRGDSIEAEAFAFLAARCLLGLPISFPGTTGVPEPMTGGRIVEPGEQ